MRFVWVQFNRHCGIDAGTSELSTLHSLVKRLVFIRISDAVGDFHWQGNHPRGLWGCSIWSDRHRLVRLIHVSSPATNPNLTHFALQGNIQIRWFTDRVLGPRCWLWWIQTAVFGWGTCLWLCSAANGRWIVETKEIHFRHLDWTRCQCHAASQDVNGQSHNEGCCKCKLAGV